MAAIVEAASLRASSTVSFEASLARLDAPKHVADPSSQVADRYRCLRPM
jgi:hypothetical protein